MRVSSISRPGFVSSVGFITAACLVCLTGAGCGSSRDCGGPGAAAPASGGRLSAAAAPAAPGPSPTARQYGVTADEFSQHMTRRMESKSAREPFQVLVLSGGGSNGAWGAGFLAGWAESGRRPEKFDVVTGVSTGALLSTGAFLGDDELLHKAYTTTRTEDVATGRFFLAIPFSDSLQDTAPLARLIEKALPDRLIDRVAAAGDENRRLFVGTTDLDTGRLVIWDLTKIAAARNYKLYRHVVLASAAVPVLYPPVRIDHHLHCDGGVRSLLFFRTRLLPQVQRQPNPRRRPFRAGRCRADDPTFHPPVNGPGYDALRRRRVRRRPGRGLGAAPAGGQGLPKPAVYVIVNGKVGVDFKCTKDGLLPIALRAVECLIDANGVADLFETKLFAEELGFDFKLSFIPEEVNAVPSDVFEPKAMTRLLEDGARDGRAVRFRDIPELDDDRGVR